MAMFSENRSSREYPGETGGSVADSSDLHLLLPDPFYRKLPARFRESFRDRFVADRRPPLLLSSQPVDIGMLTSDLVALPWYRTVFSNIGDVVSPETLPPLKLESRPVDVGELVADELGRPWWTSLVRNLADRLAPERLPALELASDPVQPASASSYLQAFEWSALINAPKVFYADRPKMPVVRVAVAHSAMPAMRQVPPEAMDAESRKLKTRVFHAKLREAFMVSAILAEVIYLGMVFFTGS